jgi:hypothetical protein
MPQTIAIAATLQIDSTGNPIVGGAAVAVSRGKQSDIVLTEGTGNNQATKTYSAERTVATAANDDIDLAGALTDIMGVSQMTFATVKAIVIRASPANTTNLSVGPAPSNGFVGPFGSASDRVTIRPGGAFVIVAPQTGFTVTPNTGDLLRVTNSAGASAIYTVEIVGT